MGRYAQRRLAGGGPTPPATGDNFIVAASQPSADVVRVTYQTVVMATDFAASDFENAIPDNPTTITQFSPTQIDLNFAGDVTGANPLSYIGTVPGYLTPDGIDY